MLAEMDLKAFVAELASDSPAPGGGSVAALSGALGVGLVSMVCRLTIGKKGYEDVEEEMKVILAESDRLASKLIEYVDADTQAFNGVMAAFKMPRGTETEKAARSAAIQAGYKEAVESPLNIARACLRGIDLSAQIVEKGNTNAISDMGVAVNQACAGLEGAVMNVDINLPLIKDEKFVSEKRKLVADMLSRGKGQRNFVLRLVDEELRA